MAEKNIADAADRPISSKNHDLLGREPFVDSLAKALVERRTETNSTSVRATGHVIGLTGEWGAGKSSLLNLLNEELGRRDRVIVVLFNPWLFSGREDLLDGFFNELASKLGKTAKERGSDILKTLDKYRGAVGAGAAGAMTLAPVDLGISARVANAIIPKHRALSAQESRVELEKKLASLGVAVVVLIDELDRVEDDEVRAVARLVKAIGDIKGISYLEKEGKLRAFVERFRDLWPSLSPDGDVSFWRGLARALVRDQDWTTGAEPQKQVTDDLETLLRIFASEGPEAAERTKTILRALIAHGDLLIAPAVLRSHLFRYGLTPDGMDRPDIPAIFTEEEIKVLIPSETVRYTEAIKSGYQLRRIPDADTIYFLLNIGAYGADLRESLTEQLDSAASLKTLATLLVPPGYIIEAKTLNVLLDSERVLPILERELESDAFANEDAWVQSAVRRLRRILRHEDPHFATKIPTSTSVIRPLERQARHPHRGIACSSPPPLNERCTPPRPIAP